MRGAMRNATCVADGTLPPVNPATSSSARSPGLRTSPQPAQAVLHDDAVLARQRHHVRHRADRHQLQKRFEHAAQLVRRPVQRRQQRLHQLERHAHAAQILFRIVAIGPVRIQHRERRRQFGFRQVMIGDDDVDRQLRWRAAPPRAARMPVSTLMISETPSAAASSTTSARMP